MSWGTALADAYDTASASAQQAAKNSMASIRDAAAAVAQLGATMRDDAVATAQAAGRVASFGARATGETANAIGRAGLALADKGLESAPLVGRAYVTAKKVLSPSKAPRQTVVEPCLNSIAGKVKRLEQRKALVDLGNSPSSTPQQKAAAKRLARNNDAVELAKLSEDAYLRYRKPPENNPPLGWSVMSAADLVKNGITPQLLADSKAVLYQTPPDWPGGQKMVLAFRGTEPKEAQDLLTNAKQALGEETVQYEAAKELGREVAKGLGSNVLVTGHSLGGGKAQAAGASGGLQGTMFNSAGLNADTVDAMPDDGQFVQFRAPGDPLTGVQNSAALQTGVVGLVGAIATPLGASAGVANFLGQTLGFPLLSQDMSAAAGLGASAFPRVLGNLVAQGNLLPKAIGKVVEAPSLDDMGQPIPATDLMGQHSVHNLVNGIEREKSEDVATLQGVV